jgi:3-deoxy-D-manno-octulosonic-acid transferase
VVFVGGSLIPLGGHDVLQPLFFGKPTLFGPHMHNQRDMAAAVLEDEAAVQVRDAADLAQEVVRAIADPAVRQRQAEAAARLLGRNTGAAAECAELLSRLARGEQPWLSGPESAFS